MVTAAEFWATKPRTARFDTIAFEHPEVDAPFRLAANVFEEVTLGGDEYRPAPMDIGWPAQNGDAQPRMSITFPRYVVGREFKQQLRLIRDAGSREPIVVTGATWLQDTDAPKITWGLYAGSVRFNTESVQVSATLDNPMTKYGQATYDPAVFTGLQGL